ncbi:hypothetical protein GGX14DRAFT_580163 [Mycena pura]|uniref:Uncharacterized protein n=1 Tax=Mycena pura TaxID=153505 RepID=A0AAD6Y1F9_9AGAR|nr:hypothetical protein GGX14DRAFT_580163 [Mycena pura]
MTSSPGFGTIDALALYLDCRTSPLVSRRSPDAPTAPSHPCGYARTPEPLIHSQLMVVYPASWSICIIGPAWGLIVLYFASTLALWRIGTPVDSQVWLCTSSARPPSPMPAGERWL